MKNDRLIDLGLTGYEELFMSTEERLDAKKPKVEAIPLAALTPFRNHPFQVKEDEEMAQLMRSIADAGVLSPALARPLPDGGYELISGHRRLAACKALGMDAMPVIVRDLTDEEAVITMVDSNLQREHILPSEKAFAYKMKYDAIKRSPGRKENGDQLGHQIKSIDSLAENSPDSRNQIQRYIRLTNLIPDILKLVDEGKIALTPAVELSYLQPSEQEMIFSVMDSDEVTPSLSQARRLRRMSEEQTLTDDAVLQLLSEVKGNQVEYVKVPVDKLRSFFRPDTSVKQMTETLVKAMDFYWRGSAETGTPGERRLAMTKMEIQTLYEVMFTDYPDIVNVAQVQAMLGISRHLAYALIGDGDIPGMKIGNAYRVPKINVIRYALSAGNPQPAA